VRQYVKNRPDRLCKLLSVTRRPSGFDRLFRGREQEFELSEYSLNWLKGER
jgi:hypothetical protein